MAKSGYVAARVEPALKKSAQAILRGVSLTTPEAITLFLHQVVLQRRLAVRGAPSQPSDAGGD
jgi:DNA-damage-inducible protein J